MALFACHPASAGPWSIEPLLGVSTDYSTNPELRSADGVAEHHIAGIFNVPLHYDVDALDVTITPSGRLSNSEGYSSLASNYARLSANAVYSTELDSLALQAGLARDSSLYDTGQIAAGYGVGVRRDGTSTAANWVRSLTERTQFQLDGGWSRAKYDQPANSTNLVDYGYYNADASLSRDLSERDSLKIISGLGRYRSLNGEAQSDSSDLQLGIVRRLSEIWTLAANAGYSRSTTEDKIFIDQFYLGTVNSDTNGTVYSFNLTRTGEQFNFTGGVSKSLQPYGSYGLSQLEIYSASGSYTLSERWAFSASAGRVQELDPTQTGGHIRVDYLNVQLRVDWHATPQWVVSFHATQDSRKFGSDVAGVESTGVSLDLTRQFLRSEL